ncbi:hypothetical protein [Stratiformator vulcanicus]|nr:hypothetical protein [Stratiformator vulcanicus]
MANPEKFVAAARHVLKYPTFFGGDPVEVHGLILGIAYAALLECTCKDFAEAAETVTKLQKEVTRDVADSHIIPIRLCDTSYPDLSPSFESLRERGAKFISLLEVNLNAGSG